MHDFGSVLQRYFFLETSAFNETETIDEINDIHANNCDYTNVHSRE